MASVNHPPEGPGTPRRKSRRSWFDAPPLTTLDLPPVERPEPKKAASKRRSLDTVETLTLTHFTNPPRLGFGKTLVGRTKIRTLLIRNPHDYEQEVIIERFPFKKKFIVDHTRFIVGPEDVFSLEIRWTPEEDGGFREMVQFHINDIYRLQAFLFGSAEKPKPPRKVRKHPLGPRIRQPHTVLQTPALTNIKTSYSPRRSQEARELMEDFTLRQQGEDKENSGGQSTFCGMAEIQQGSIKTQPVDTPNVGNENKQDVTDQKKDLIVKKSEVEALKSPPPLESTTIGGNQEKGLISQKNRRQWRNISDITSPTLNMSPIPLSEGNENGITVDSSFHPNETTAAGLIKSDKCSAPKYSVQDQQKDNTSKDKFIMPQPPSDLTNVVNKKEVDCMEDRYRLTQKESLISCSVAQTSYQTARTDETQIIRQNVTHLVGSGCIVDSQEIETRRSKSHTSYTAMDNAVRTSKIEMKQRSDWASPKTSDNGDLSRSSPSSPRTMLDESLKLISQTKMPTRSNEVSPGDGNTSINSSFISQGKGMVSPKSFLEDMKNMTGDGFCKGKNGSQNTSTPNAFSPSSVLNNSIPHNIMINHLENVKTSLQNTPPPTAFVLDGSKGTPRKGPSAQFPKKRRSITKQFQKEEERRIAAAARAVKKDKESLAKSTHLRAVPVKKQYSPKGKRLLLDPQSVAGPRRGTFVLRNASRENRGVGGKKKSPLCKRSPRNTAMKKEKINKSNKKQSPKSKLHSVVESKLGYIGGPERDQHGVSKGTSLQQCEDKLSLCTPAKDQQMSDIGTIIKRRSIETGTVVKRKSTGSPSENGVTVVKRKCSDETDGRFFDDLFVDKDDGKENNSHRNSSMIRRGKLFPDIQVEDVCDGAEMAEAAEITSSGISNLPFTENGKSDNISQDDPVTFNDEVTCKITQESSSKSSLNSPSEEDEVVNVIGKGNETTPASSRMSHFERVVSAAERSMSPQRFHAMSPSNLPGSPGAGQGNSRRGTLTVTKSRPSDALLQAMNNRKRLFQDSTQPSLHHTKEDDSETQENIRVKVEEHYQEVDGKMYLVVKETTDVIKSTTDTYMEQLTVSPQQFQTPTQLPNSPDPQMSRRSTHVVRSPKVIDVTAMNVKRLEFGEEKPLSFVPLDGGVEEKSEGSGEKTAETQDLHVEEHKLIPSTDSLEPDKTKSNTFEKESTIIATPVKSGLSTTENNGSIKDSEHPITAVCAMSPRLVDYDDVASENSNDVTKDSLDTNQSIDSLNNSEDLCGDVCKVNKEKEHDSSTEETLHDVVSEGTVPQKETLSKKACCPGNEEKHKKETDQCSTVSEDEEEQYYDTMSERYYDALSDTLNADGDDRPVSPQNVCSETNIADSETDNVIDGKELSSDKNITNDLELLRCHQISAKTSKPEKCAIQKLVGNTSVSNEIGDLKKHYLQKEKITIEKSLDHREIFQVVERECFEAQPAELLAPVETIISNTPEGKSKRKLRRSVSADGLSPVAFMVDASDIQTKPTQMTRTQHAQEKTRNISTKKPMVQSKSAVFVRPTAQVPKKNPPPKMSINKDHRPGLKQRSQSLTSLTRKTELEKKTLQKTTPNTCTVKSQPAIKIASQISASSSKQKGQTKGVAQRKLIFVKKSKTSAPRHPMPFAARNMYYDERWIDKQERGFVQWLNFVLTPPDEYVAVTSKAKVDAGSLSLDHRSVAPRLAPTKEILSFRSYAARRRLNRLRRAACELYQSDSVVNIICKVETEVESRRIAVRKDRMVHADLGIKQRLLDLLLHYSSLWLRIGLETVFGEVLMLQSNQDVVGLSRFIVTRLLASPDIAAEFAHPTVPHLYKDGYAAAVSRHTVKKFLLLVYFLDQAKASRLIDHDPCLFCKDADTKSSKEILVQFSCEILSGEGDITRHLAYMGYTVSHTQKPIDEFDFAVTNLSSDLRDGLRLSRVLELLANNHGIMGKLRTPAISRLQKIHNMENFFKAMSERGLSLSSTPGAPVTARDVVDGHREKTLSLLWHLIIHFQSCIQVNEAHLKEEIDILMKSLRLKLAMQNIGAIPSIEDCQARRDSGETKLLMENERLQLIFQWCRLVCLHYGVRVENFTVSFSDGRALCCLLHHYHPALLPLSEIRFQTTVSFQEAAEDRCQVDTDPDLSVDWGTGGGMMPDEDNPEKFEHLLANEKANFKTLYEKVSALSGVPLMLRFADMSNTIPDEKVVSTYVSYLCARLLDIREEVRAARLIQMAWRRRHLRRAIKERKRRTEAATKIQRWIRPFLAKHMQVAQIEAAICIQAAWRGHKARVNVLRQREKLQEEAWRAGEEKAAVALQSLWRCRSARHKLAKLQEEQRKENLRRREENAATTLQRHWRSLRCRKDFLKQRTSAIKIQAAWRRQMAKNVLNTLRLEQMEKSAVVIQKWMKRYLRMNQYEKQKSAVILLQKNWRMKQAQVKLQHLRVEKQNGAAIAIQKYIRRKLCERKYLVTREATVTLQRYWKVRGARKQLAKLKYERDNKASTVMQSIFKAALCRRAFLEQKNAAIQLQKNWRRHLAEKELDRLRFSRDNKAATILQKHMKGYQVRKEFVTMKNSAIVLQSFWRMLQAKTELKTLRMELQIKSAITIQKHMRGFRCRQQIQQWKQAALTIQKIWRRNQAMKLFWRLKYERENWASTVIQKWWRGFRERKQFVTVKSAVVLIQKNLRMAMARKELNKRKQQRREHAALILQANVKGWRCQQSFIKMKKATMVLQRFWRVVQAKRILASLRLERQERAAVLIQKTWKGHLVHQNFVRTKKATILLQSYWKMILARQKYWQMYEAAVLIQAWQRGNIAAKVQRKTYLKQREAAICIQSWWRCRIQQDRYITIQQAAVVIQAHFRCFRRRLKYSAVRLATVIIQRSYRNYLEGKKVRQEYLAMGKAAVIIQRHIRAYLYQKWMVREASALVLQTAFRRFIARQKYMNQKRAAELIQRRFRDYKRMTEIRHSFLQQKQAVCAIQSAYRAYSLRKQYLHVCDSVVRIQALVRGKLSKKCYESMKNAAVTIQRKYRAVKFGEIFREAFLLIRKSAITIQRFYRAVQARREVQAELKVKHLAATKIQALYRGWSQCQDYRMLQAAVVCLQRRYRALRAGQCARIEFILKKKAAYTIQITWRSYTQIQEAKRRLQERREEVQREIERQLEEERQRKEQVREQKRKDFERKMQHMRKEKAAIILQRSIRAFLMMRDYTKRENAAVTIQKYVRGHQARLEYIKERQQILWLQLLIKSFACYRRFQRMRLAAVIIQRRWREIREGRCCQAEYLAIRKAAVKIQAQFKMKHQRDRYQNIVRQMTMIQSCVRMFLHKQRYTRLKQHTELMQRRVRSKQLMRKERKAFVNLRQSAIKIQFIIRVWLAYRHVQRERSVIKIQAHWRMRKQRLAFCQEFEAVQILKTFMKAKQEQLDKQTREMAARVIQCSFRRYQKKQANARFGAACVIQRAFRKVVSLRWEKKNAAALIIQRTIRRYVKMQLVVKHQSATIIQTAMRQFLARQKYLIFHRSVIKLQVAIKGWHARRLVESLRQRHCAAKCLQAAVRGFLARKKIRPILQERLQALEERRRQHRASMKIQALWRGFVTRRDTKSRKLVQTRKRLEEVNRRATREKTLGSRTSSALDYLLREKDLAYILEALMHLEVSTRLSPVCCERMVEVNAVSVLYRLINSCNRSIPHMELIKYSVNILLNLAKYEKTVSAVMEPEDSVASILELLQIYREKGAIFFNCCMLLGILGLHPGRRAKILEHPNVVSRLQSFHALALRKQRANQNRQVTQAKMAAMRSFSCTLPVLTPSKSKRKRIRPEWALARDNIKDFDDPVAAVTFVMDILHIGPKT